MLISDIGYLMAGWTPTTPDDIMLYLKDRDSLDGGIPLPALAEPSSYMLLS